MDTSKLMTLICAFVLVVCLTLSITTLTVLRNAMEENGSLQEEAAALVGNLNTCIGEMNEMLVDDSIPTGSDTSIPSNTDTDRFCIRAINGQIGIYTTDGYLVRLLDVSVDTLPQKDRDALNEGILVNSWRDLIAIIQDYTA